MALFSSNFLDFWSEAKASLQLAIPLMLIQLSEGAVNFVDTLMMGGLGTAALAAGGLGATAFWMLLSLCTGLLEIDRKSTRLNSSH